MFDSVGRSPYTHLNTKGRTTTRSPQTEREMMMAFKPTQNQPDHFQVRMPEGMREELKALATEQRRSTNSQIVLILKGALSDRPKRRAQMHADDETVERLAEHMFPILDGRSVRVSSNVLIKLLVNCTTSLGDKIEAYQIIDAVAREAKREIEALPLS